MSAVEDGVFVEIGGLSNCESAQFVSEGENPGLGNGC